MIYTGVCPADGCSSFRATIHPDWDYTKCAVREATKIVEQRYLDTPSLRVRSYLVRQASDAPSLVELMTEQFSGSHAGVEMLTCQDGEIIFERTLTLNGWTRESQEAIVEKLVKLPFQPLTPFRSELHYLMTNPNANEYLKNRFVKLVQEEDRAEPWKKSLSFIS